MITIQIFFTSLGTPATGLTPTITILNTLTSAVVINGASCPEVGMGFYYYNFSYDANTVYSVIVDGGNTLQDAERYKYTTVPDIGRTIGGSIG